MLRDITAPIGVLRAEETDGFITGLRLTDETVCREAGTSVLLLRLETELYEYFRGGRRVFDLPVRAAGTGFRKTVWDALRQIPYGEVRSYGEIAAVIGAPGAARAVGGACNHNPVLLLIPCHRVVGASGDMTGFGCGIYVKETLLSFEGHNIVHNRILRK